MIFCKNCFRDENLRDLLDGMGSVGKGYCKFCGSKNVDLYEDDGDGDLAIAFEERLVEFSHLKTFKEKQFVRQHETLKQVILRWNIFSDKLSGKKIILFLKALLPDLFQRHKYLANELVYLPEIYNRQWLEKHAILKGLSWEDFKQIIKEQNRFHPINMVDYELSEKIFSYLTRYLWPRKKLYRARIEISGVIRKCSKKQLNKNMGIPPIEKRTDGRVSAMGIKCLYLTIDKQTAVSEVRAGLYDRVCVGEFKVLRKTKIADLTLLEKFSFSPFDESTNFKVFEANHYVLKCIASEMLSPLRRSDNTLSYIPTQYFVDLIKRIGYDGVKYRSVMNKEGYCFAMFKPENFDCVDIEKINIDTIKYNE